MPKIANRSFLIPDSPIRKLVQYALDAEAAGTTVHYLNIGQPDIDPPTEFWDGVKAYGSRQLAYEHSLGNPELRDAFAAYYQGRGVAITIQDMMVTNGGSEAAFIAFLTLFDPGDEVVVIEPFYANFASYAAAAGIVLVPVTTHIEDSFSLPPVEAIASKVGPKTRGILLCNPTNPTGTAYPPAAMLEIAKIARALDLFLIVDEVYGDFYYGEEPYLSILQVEGMEDLAVVMDSASKKLSLCGARVGFLVSRNQSVMKGALKFGMARLSVPTLEQAGVAHCLRHTKQTYFDDVRHRYIERRDLIHNRLSSIPGVVCPDIDGAFYAMVRLPVDDSDRFCEWMIKSFRHRNQTLLLAPASGFYITEGLGKDEVRIAYVLKPAKLHEAMDVLEAALQAYPGRTI